MVTYSREWTALGTADDMYACIWRMDRDQHLAGLRWDKGETMAKPRQDENSMKTEQCNTSTRQEHDLDSAQARPHTQSPAQQ